MKSVHQIFPMVIALYLVTAPVSVFGQGASISKTMPPQRQELVAALTNSQPMKKLSKEYDGKMIIFTEVSDHVDHMWAWIQATPQTGDSKAHFDPVSGVMHKVQEKWQMVEWVGDEVSAADDPKSAFKKWCQDFVKKHPGCPVTIFPNKA